MSKKYHWVLFDFDGTLVNSVPALYNIYLNFLKENGSKGSKREFAKLNGPTLSEIVMDLKKHHRLSNKFNSLIKDYNNRVLAAYEKGVKPFKYSNTVLKTLSSLGYKLMLVTSSKKDVTMKFINKQKWGSFFSKYTFGDEIKTSKPDPEIYRLSLKKIEPVKSAVIIEDSENGVKSAKAVGARVIAISNLKNKNGLTKQGADIVVENIHDILPILNNFKKKNIEPNYKIEATGKIYLSESKTSSFSKITAKKKQLINKIWEQCLLQKGNNLFNGTLLSFVGISQHDSGFIIKGRFVEYKYFIAQRKHSSLNLRIFPIGVSGIIIFNDGGVSYTLLAKRAKNVTQYPDFYELAPSGSIDKSCVDKKGKIDYTAKLLTELREEIGISSSYVKKITGFSFIFDKNDKVYDIGCIISLNITKKLVLLNFRKSKEYTKFLFVPTSKLKKFVDINSDKIIPTTKALIKTFTEYSAQTTIE